jgi:hypothetical protein
MPLVDREKEERVINCIQIVLNYNHVPYPGKGLKTEIIQSLVQDCRAQHKREAKLVQRTNQARTKVVIWIQIASNNDPFANAVFDSIKNNCTYDGINMEFMQFSFHEKQLNSILPCKVATREDGTYISGEEPVEVNSYNFDYSNVIKDNNMYKRKKLNDYSSDNMKSLLSDSSGNEQQGLKRKFVGGTYKYFIVKIHITFIILLELPFRKKAKRGIILLPFFIHVSQLLLTICKNLDQPIASTSHTTQLSLGMPTGMTLTFYNHFQFIVNKFHLF